MVNFIVKVKRRYRLFEIWWWQLLLDIGASVTSGAAGNKQTSGWYLLIVLSQSGCKQVIMHF